MDSSDETSEVVFRRDGTMDLDTGAEESSEDSTEHRIIDTVTSSAEPTVTSKDQAINSVLLYLMEEVKKLKKGNQSVSVKREPSESSLSDADDDDISTMSSRTVLIPKDLGR